MFCIVAFIILSILGIFSATHRALAREALACVLRRVTLRPCNSDFSEKMKGKIIAKLLERSDFLARIFNKYFEILSWIFFILLVASTIWTVRGLYNYYFYGSCNGLNASGFCVLDIQGENNQISSGNQVCTVPADGSNVLTAANTDWSIFPSQNNGEKNVIFIGCYACDYSRKAYPIIKKLVEKKQVNYIFAHYPTKETSNYLGQVNYCAYEIVPSKYWKLQDELFASPKDKLADKNYIKQVLNNADFVNSEEILACAETPEAISAAKKQVEEISKTNIQGTPTVFINDEPLVGPKPYRVYKWALIKPW